MKDELADLVEAMAALDKTVPDGTFERFSRKVAARLEGGMERTDSSVNDRSRAGDEPAVAGPLPAREENSGMHEIRELATTAKRRLSARSSSQPEPADDLLTTSGQFKTVVLPDPGRRSGPLPVAGTTATAPSPATPSRGGRGVMWAALGAAALAAVAAIVLFVTRPSTGAGSAADETTLARSEAAPAKPSSAPTAQPTAPSPTPAASAAASAEPAKGPSAELEAVPAEQAAPAAAGGAAGAPQADRQAAERSRPDDRDSAGDAPGARPERAADRRQPPVIAEAKTLKEKEARKGKAKAKAGSMDELLSTVTGGVEESRPAPTEPSKPAKPDKSGLDRDDVSRAMSAIGDRARACHDEEGAVGSVNIRFTVDPSGKVTRASASGKFSGTATGRCVAAAVKSASFPRWNGSPMSFTYPFLLSQ